MRRPATSTGLDPNALAHALACFAHGFAFSRSATHPCLAEAIDDGRARVWVIRDAPRRDPRHYRREEFVSADLAPGDLLTLARARTRGRFVLCVVLPEGRDDTDLRAAFRALRCRLATTEPLMTHDLSRIPRSPDPVEVVRVVTPEHNAALAKYSNRRPLADAFLAADSPLRAYIALHHGKVVGNVRSITTPPVAGQTHHWVADLHVHAAHRRRGIGSALLRHLLRDDRARGATHSTLLASHTGALLYPHLGYRRLGTLYLYQPPK